MSDGGRAKSSTGEGFRSLLPRGTSPQGGSARNLRLRTPGNLTAAKAPAMLDTETGHNSADISDVEHPRFRVRNGKIARRKLHVLKADDPADLSRSLPERLETIAHALTAKNLAQLLQVSEVTIYKLAKANKLPSFRIGTAVRFDPRVVARWLRQA